MAEDLKKGTVIAEHRYVLSVKVGRDIKCEIDHGPGISDEEFEQVLVELRKILGSLEHNFKFKLINDKLIADITCFIVDGINKFGKVVDHQRASETEVLFAFTV